MFDDLSEEILDFSTGVIKAIEILMKKHEVCGEKITFEMAAKIVEISYLAYNLSDIGNEIGVIKNCLDC